MPAEAGNMCFPTHFIICWTNKCANGVLHALRSRLKIICYLFGWASMYR